MNQGLFAAIKLATIDFDDSTYIISKKHLTVKVAKRTVKLKRFIKDS